MIWFACIKCGKVHGRAEASAGALVFCECGHGQRVPWESTTAEPATTVPLAAPAVGPLEPISFSRTPVTPSAPRTRDRKTREGPIDPNLCFNHIHADTAGVCSECGLSFCHRCLLTFRNATYCSACKNYRTRLLQRRPESSRLGLGSVLIALAAGPISLLLVPLETSRPGQHFLLLSLLAPIAAIAVGIVSLRWIRQAPERVGQQLAISGIVLAVVVGVFATLLICFGQKLLA